MRPAERDVSEQIANSLPKKTPNIIEGTAFEETCISLRLTNLRSVRNEQSFELPPENVELCRFSSA